MLPKGLPPGTKIVCNKWDGFAFKAEKVYEVVESVNIEVYRVTCERGETVRMDSIFWGNFSLLGGSCMDAGAEEYEEIMSLQDVKV